MRPDWFTRICLCLLHPPGFGTHREFKKFCISNEERVRVATALATAKNREHARQLQRERTAIASSSTAEMKSQGGYLSSTSIREMARADGSDKGTGLGATAVGSTLDDTLKTLPMSTYTGSTLALTNGVHMPVNQALGTWARDSNKLTYKELQRGVRGKEKSLVSAYATFHRVESVPTLAVSPTVTFAPANSRLYRARYTSPRPANAARPRRLQHWRRPPRTRCCLCRPTNTSSMWRRRPP